MKTHHRIWPMLLAVVLCLLTVAAIATAGRGELTQESDWTIGSGWTAKESPAGLWLEYTGTEPSMEGLSYRKELPGAIDLTYYLTFRHAKSTVDCSTLVLREADGEGKYLLRVKSCNGDLMVEGEYYNGVSWTTILSPTAWQHAAGSNVRVRLIRAEGSGVLHLNVKSGTKTVFDSDTLPVADNFLSGNGSCQLRLGCDEGNLALTNLLFAGE